MLLIVIEIFEKGAAQRTTDEVREITTDFRNILKSEIIDERPRPQCKPGERIDVDGICRYIYGI